MIIGRSCFRKLKNDFVIENYPNLEKIVVGYDSLTDLNSLKICKCEQLKTIEIEDGDLDQGDSIISAFRNVKNVIIESTCLLIIIHFQIFQIYNHSKQDIGHS